jgi:general secretion pathway protein C
MIEPSPSAMPPIRRGNQLSDRENRAAQLADDLQQILSFAAREFERPRHAAIGHRDAGTPTPPAQPREAPLPSPERGVDAAVAASALENTWRETAQVRRDHAMAGPQAGAWRHGLLRNLPTLVSVTLGGLIAVELARASMTLFGGGPPTAPLPAVALDMHALDRPVIDVGRIVAAQLFGAIAADPSTQDPSGSPRSAANLRLAGTLATANPKTGFAIISGTGPAQVYTVGASVGGASLYAVYRDHVMLSRNGILESLMLPKLSVGKGRAGAPEVAAPNTAAGNEPKTLDASNARTVSDAVRTSAAVDPNGRLRGFRVFPNGNREAFDKSGLRGGDLLVAVNGISVQDQDRQTGKEILNSLSTSGAATVTIERNGERQDLTINAPADSLPPE